MAITIQAVKLHTGRQNPWAYEIPATFIDSEDGHHNIMMVFKAGEPTQSEIDDMVAFWKAKLEAEPVEEPIIAEDGTEI